MANREFRKRVFGVALVVTAASEEVYAAHKHSITVATTGSAVDRGMISGSTGFEH